MSKNEAKLTDAKTIVGIADQLQKAEADRKQVPPIVADLGSGNVEAAYQVQAELTRRRIAAGSRLVGRKIGLTSVAVQQQLGVSEPDFGALFSEMEAEHGGQIETARLIQPRIEAEIALVLDRDLERADATMAELMRAVAFVAPASRSSIAASPTGRLASSIPSQTMAPARALCWATPSASSATSIC